MNGAMMQVNKLLLRFNTSGITNHTEITPSRSIPNRISRSKKLWERLVVGLLLISFTPMDRLPQNIIQLDSVAWIRLYAMTSQNVSQLAVLIMRFCHLMVANASLASSPKYLTKTVESAYPTTATLNKL